MDYSTQSIQPSEDAIGWYTLQYLLDLFRSRHGFLRAYIWGLLLSQRPFLVRDTFIYREMRIRTSNACIVQSWRAATLFLRMHMYRIVFDVKERAPFFAT